MAKKILIIEDSRFQAAALALELSELGCQTVTAADGKTALEKLAEDIDVVVLDTILPDINGYQLCGMIRKLRPEGTLTVIMTTEKIDSVNISKAREAGADDYAVKTQDFKHLVGVTKKYL